MEQKLPVGVNAMTAAVILSNFFIFGLFAYAFPAVIFPDVNEAAEYPVRFFAIRYRAFSVPLLHGLLHQNRTLPFAVNAAIGTGMFILPMTAAVVYLAKTATD